VIGVRIIVDADACPGKVLIEKAARENGIEVIMFCDYNHMLTSDYSTIRVVDSGFQSVDMKIVNEAKENDIVISQDYGLASIILPKKAFAISPKGYIYDESNIETLLEQRHIYAKIRKGGGKTTNPKKRTEEDNARLYRNLLYLINKGKK
jgi:uncharacterized protein YaiI (UPF0178 family)